MNGYVYVFQNREGIVKIGRTKSPNARKKTLENMSGGQAIKFYLSREVGNSEKVEAAVHKSLQGNKVHGEWFRCEFAEAQNAVEKEVREVGTETKEPTGVKGFDCVAFSMEKLIEETDKINRENEALKRQLIQKGWSESEVQFLVRMAERDACEKICGRKEK